LTDARQSLVVDTSRDNIAISALVRERMGVAWAVAKKLCARGKVKVDGTILTDPGARVRTGSVVEIDPGARVVQASAGPVSGGGSNQTAVLERERLVYHDTHIVVFNKPPGINTVPFEDGERGTLVDRLAASLHKWGLAPSGNSLFAVHRLDRETSGLIVFARTWIAQRHLATLFRAHAVERTYVALAHGDLQGSRTYESYILDDRGDGLRGSARSKKITETGRRAVTHARNLATLPGEGGASMVECKLETGRQHQIRIHLSEAGHPIIGDRVYIRGYKGIPIMAPRVMLHARTLGFTHPTCPDEPPVTFEIAPPEDFDDVATQLGRVK
jgi:23S rRNA pseudouridine1911/1915/1917 synthase